MVSPIVLIAVAGQIWMERVGIFIGARVVHLAFEGDRRLPVAIRGGWWGNLRLG